MHTASIARQRQEGKIEKDKNENAQNHTGTVTHTDNNSPVSDRGICQSDYIDIEAMKNDHVCYICCQKKGLRKA